MPGIPIRRKGGPISFAVVETIVGGQVVEARAGGIGVAAAGTVKHLGVAIDDGVPASTFTGTTAPLNGRPNLNTAPLPNRVGLAHSGDEVPVKYAAPAAFGDALIAAANGAVTPAGANPDARTIVGKCIELGGVVANAVGFMRVK